MPAYPLSDEQAIEAAEAYRRRGLLGHKLLKGVTGKAFEARVRVAIERGLLKRSERKSVPPDTPMPKAKVPSKVVQPLEHDALRAAISKEPRTLEQLARRFEQPERTVQRLLAQMLEQGINVQEHGGRYSIQHAPAPKHQLGGELPVYRSRADGTYLFGFTSDNHLGSKYARQDVLDKLYDEFAAQGVDRVFNAGNWIDGEARFNMHDLEVHGMDAQCAHLAAMYPQRPGITTYAVAGNDHEGWYCQREGVDIGRYAERTMRDAGRADWVDLGFMEAFVRLEHARSKAGTTLHVIHPGGGSAYALSYTTQKLAEAYDGGEKPAVALVGHYHKLGYHMSRNVHMIQTGCTEDQTPFMRQRKLAAHVGGGICRLKQDEASGAIESCRVEFFSFFVRGYYNNRWNMAGKVKHAQRLAA